MLRTLFLVVATTAALAASAPAGDFDDFQDLFDDLEAAEVEVPTLPRSARRVLEETLADDPLHFRFVLAPGMTFGVPAGGLDADQAAVLEALGAIGVGALRDERFSGPTEQRFYLDYTGFQIPYESMELDRGPNGRCAVFFWSHDLEGSPRVRVGPYPTGVVTAIDLVPLGDLQRYVDTQSKARAWLAQLVAERAGRASGGGAGLMGLD